MVIKVVGLVLLLMASLARAGNMTCVYNGDTRVGGSAAVNAFYFAAGQCTLSNSYATGGDSFPGPDSAAQNAAFWLCGYTGATIRVVVLSGQANGLLMQYDSTNYKFKTFLPTRNAAVISAITGTATSSRPSFHINKGAVLAGTELGLTVDAATASVTNNTIADNLDLVTNSPVSTPIITLSLDPLSTTIVAGAGLEPAAGVDGSIAGPISFIAVCNL